MSNKDIPYGGNPLYNGHKPQAKESGSVRGTIPQTYPEGFTIAVDFDGTLCNNAFPNIGEPRPLLIEYIKRQAATGARIILHTCRENGTVRPLLDEAVAFCEAHGVPLFAINENPYNPFGELYGTGTGRKVYADMYIDDKAASVAEIENKMK